MRHPGGMAVERIPGEAPGWNDGGEDSGCETLREGGSSMDWIPDARHPGRMAEERTSGVRHPDGMTAQKDSGRETSKWNGGAEGFRM